ncbi:MAG: DUF1801 domain-containing protein [Verrucomicrobia bacterium]|nr:DUF1801 domain-containing protein [Verrucomicrobiota bacterium]
MKAAAHIQTPAEYLASLPTERRATLTAIHQAIRKAAPKLRPHIAYGMLGYGDYRYRYADGREAVGPVIALASQKQYISLYLGCEADGSLAAEDKKRLGKVSTGKCCIRFKKLADLNLKVAMELVKKAAAVATKK